MNGRLYSKLARDGIVNNKKLYIPYIITNMGMVMMYYIICSLSNSPLLNEMTGGDTVNMSLTLGKWVIAIFSAIFLFYTGSFVSKQRNREFGLYNVLGMDKRGISRIITWESMYVSVAGLAGGLFFGIVLSKLSELMLCNIIKAKIDYTFRIDMASVGMTLIIYISIFFILYLNFIRSVSFKKALILMKSTDMGEKPPRGNMLLAAIGIIILGTAYYMAVSIETPLAALTWFFVAVVMVIIATYILFVTGSVVLCRLLQHNKKYYYKPNHFVAVSSMAYRMKRNGAGLASICILCTFVLVIISSTVSLYIGAQDSINTIYPYDISVQVTFNNVSDINDRVIGEFREVIDKCVSDNNIGVVNKAECIRGNTFGLLEGDKFILDSEAVESFTVDYDNLYEISIMSLDDYNRLSNDNRTLEDGEAYIYCYRNDYTNNTFKVADTQELKVKEILEDFPVDGDNTASVLPTLYVVVSNYSEYAAEFEDYVDYNGDAMLRNEWYYNFDIDGKESIHADVRNDIYNSYRTKSMEENTPIYCYYVDSKVMQKDDFYTVFGGLFFIGIMLSVMFVFATVLIIYYKQITEGYEDRSKFEIMRKVGMTAGDIRRSINSQILTVFIAPLVLAAAHLIFAFPLIWKLLILFNLHNMPLVIMVTITVYIIFAVMYAIVYKITSNEYYDIVS